MTERRLGEQEAIEILERYVPADQLERVRIALNLPMPDRNPTLQERTYLFENAFGSAHVEVLLANGREVSVYVIWLPRDQDRFPTRKAYCESIAEALQKIWWAGDQLRDPYRLTRWWIHDEDDYNLKDAWRDRNRHHASRCIGIWPGETTRGTETDEDEG